MYEFFIFLLKLMSFYLGLLRTISLVRRHFGVCVIQSIALPVCVNSVLNCSYFSVPNIMTKCRLIEQNFHKVLCLSIVHDL